MRNNSIDHEILECLTLMMKKLNDEYLNGALLVVEGQRDAEALRSIGYIGEPFTLCHNESVSSLVTKAQSHSKVILLLDRDQKGRILTKRVARVLEERKIRLDLFFRRRLSSATKGQVSQVEDLKRYRDHFENFVSIPITFDSF